MSSLRVSYFLSSNQIKENTKILVFEWDLSAELGQSKKKDKEGTMLFELHIPAVEEGSPLVVVRSRRHINLRLYDTRLIRARGVGVLYYLSYFCNSSKSNRHFCSNSCIITSFRVRPQTTYDQS